MFSGEVGHMSYTSTAKLLSARFENYLTGVFRPIPQERIVAGMIQSFYVWFFAILRNAFICGVLRYLADKSQSPTLETLAYVAYLVLAAYCLSYINMWVLTPFHFVKYKRLGVLLDGLVTVTVLLALWYAILWGIPFAIGEIASGHAASHNAS
jgi:hypothetical protein